MGRSTLREAIRIVESLGLVDVRPGGGTFLREPPAAPHAANPPIELFSRWTTRLHLFELRAVLEPGLAALAARRVTPEYAAKLRAVLAEQAARVQQDESGLDEDMTFHALIAKATGNPVLVQLMETITHLHQPTRDASLQGNGRPEQSLKQNKAIFEAIEARNPALAMRRMQAHIRSLERTLFATGLQSAGALEFGYGGGDNGTRAQIAASGPSGNGDETWDP